MQQTFEQYNFQPHIAPSDVTASLRYGYVQGLARDDMELVQETQEYCTKVIEYFKGNEYYNFVNKFGRGRMSELLNVLEDSVVDLAGAGMTMRQILDVIPESDVDIHGALSSLADLELLALR